MHDVYFDNAASTCLSERVRQEIFLLSEKCYGNPSSLHNMGLDAELVIKSATKRLSALLNGGQMVYTSGGTESNNMAIFGVAGASRGRRVITTQTEHPSVLEPFRQLEKRGYDVVYLPVDRYGAVDPELAAAGVNDDTCLISIMAVNNEVGTIQDLEAIGRAVKRKNSKVCFHADGIQAFGKHAVDLDKCQIDLFSISGHKIHAPKGIGALYVRRGTRISPLIYGGGQQRGLRSGTENVTGIAALATAAEEAFTDMPANERHAAGIKQALINGIGAAAVNGGANGSPYILNVSFEGVRSEVMLHSLEGERIYVSAGSACSSKAKENPVLAAYGMAKERAESAVRFSFSRFNTPAEAEYAAEKINAILAAERKRL